MVVIFSHRTVRRNRFSSFGLFEFDTSDPNGKNSTMENINWQKTMKIIAVFSFSSCCKCKNKNVLEMNKVSIYLSIDLCIYIDHILTALITLLARDARH